MNLNKKQVIEGQQTYALTEKDVIVVKVKGEEVLKFKVPENWQGTITATINGILTEIIPT